MKRLTSWVLSSFVLGLVILGPVLATAENQSRVPHTVEDKATLFSKEARDKADELIAQIKKDYNKDIAVETIEKIDIPSSVTTTKAIDAYVTQFIEKQYKLEHVDGVLILISKHPAKFRVHYGMKTEMFPKVDRQRLEDALDTHLKDDKDGALLAAVKVAHDTMVKHVPRYHPPVNTTKSSDPPKETNWVLIIVCVIGGLLVLWLIMGIIRAVTAPRPNYGGPGGPGGGYGGGGYGGGGGGGGFFSSLLGGMFGAAAGMWMYSHFFGGSNFNSPMQHDSGSTNTGGGDYGAGDQNDGSSTGGGDWGGDNQTGADGGKDTGGGDSGGGDWGGGGGDTGGGDTGGGDWGGGGDTGGGGGDWGGGGGGGDWGGGGGGDFGGGGGGGDW